MAQSSAAGLLNWGAERLQQQLQAGLLAPLQASGLMPHPLPVQVQVVPQTGSTNTDLLEPVRQDPSGALCARVLLAQSQTAGRGRLGRQWHAAPGASLTFSMGLPLRPRHGWGALSLAVGHALAQALQPWGGGAPEDDAGRLMLKWPNDLWWFDEAPQNPAQRAAGRKLAGILIETLPLPDSLLGVAGLRWVVVGIGVNIDSPMVGASDWPEQGVAGTAIWRPGDDAPTLWHVVVPPLVRAVVEFEQAGFEALRPLVERRDVLVGQPVSLSAGPVEQGQCLGIDADGALRVQSPGGIHRVVAGEARVRPSSPPS